MTGLFCYIPNFAIDLINLLFVFFGMILTFGKIENFKDIINFSYKFLIVKQEPELVFYSDQVDDNSFPDYHEIARRFNISLEKIVRRGLVDHGGGGRKTLGIWSGQLEGFAGLACSSEYTGMIKSDLLKFYKTVCHELEYTLNLCNDKIA